MDVSLHRISMIVYSLREMHVLIQQMLDAERRKLVIHLHQIHVKIDLDIIVKENNSMNVQDKHFMLAQKTSSMVVKMMVIQIIANIPKRMNAQFQHHLFAMEFQKINV